MLRALAKTSLLVKLLEKIRARRKDSELRIEVANKNSRNNKIIRNLSHWVNIYASYSFLGKISEVNIGINNAILDESKVLKWAVRLFNECRQKISSYLKTSAIGSSIKQISGNLSSLPVRTTGFIIIIAILTNIILSILLKKEIKSFGWFIRWLFLFIGFNALQNNSSWEKIRATSCFLKLLDNSCKM